MLAIKNAKIFTVTNGVIEKGVVLIDGGKIKSVDAKVSVPKGAEVIDAAGKWLTPALIDCHAHPSMYEEPHAPKSPGDLNEITDPITPQLRVLDAFNPQHPAFGHMRRAGFSAGCSLPGSANLIGGQGICYKNHKAAIVDDMVIPGSEQMKMALGENPRRCYSELKRMPSTRMGNGAVLREALFKAKLYSDKLLEAEKDPSVKVERDFKLDALVPVVRGEMHCRIHCHRTDDIVTAIRISEEFGLDYVLEHATEAIPIADYLAAKHAICVVGPITMGPVKQEVWQITPETCRVLDEAGVTVCITRDGSSDVRFLPHDIGYIIARHGLKWETALKALTINAAKAMHLDGRMGSIEPGKDADIAIWSGDPFCNYTLCEATVIDGVVYRD